MATRMTPRVPGLLLIFFATLAVIFLVAKYYEIDARKARAIARNAAGTATVALNRLGVVRSCESGAEFKVIAIDMYICTDPSTTLVYEDVYYRYPASAEGRERIYTFLDRGDRQIADQMLDNIINIERYEPVQISDPPTWEEDPFGERYWRFIYYSLRNTRHLLSAALETKDERYFEKLSSTIEDFLDRGIDKPHAWDDYHGVAFRTMTLVNTWWKLRQEGKLSGELSDKILAALERHGDSLLDPAHYEAGNNHGITQAAALLVLAENFPDLKNAPAWRDAAIQRIDSGLRDIVDEDGVLIENSPYYHFYVLEKYWQIYAYAQKYGIAISDAFESTLSKMLRHATFVLQPDQNMPLLGASIPRQIERSGEFRLMAEQDPFFDYVVSGGTRGKKPPQRNVFYPSSGIAVFRSGWGEERAFQDETQVIFDTGPYRTDHSDLDIMSFSVYADGVRVIREGGLFTYEVDNPLYDYFHGTRAHNTVMVDGKDQARDEGRTQGLVEGDSWSYLSAEQDAYPGVRHSRALALIEDGAVLIVDALASANSHTYEQLLHLPPEAAIDTQTQGLVEGSAAREDGVLVPFSIQQFSGTPKLSVWKGDESGQRGLCADGYEILRECYELSYETVGAVANYVTLIRFGESGMAYTASFADNVLTINTGNAEYRIAITFPPEEVLGSGYVELDIQKSGTGGAWWQKLLDSLRNLL